MKHTTLNVRMHTNAWYETDFMSSFAALIAHKSHVGSIQFVHCLLPTSVKKSIMHIGSRVSYAKWHRIFTYIIVF